MCVCVCVHKKIVEPESDIIGKGVCLGQYIILGGMECTFSVYIYGLCA